MKTPEQLKGAIRNMKYIDVVNNVLEVGKYLE